MRHKMPKRHRRHNRQVTQHALGLLCPAHLGIVSKSETFPLCGLRGPFVGSPVSKADSKIPAGNPLPNTPLSSHRLISQTSRDVNPLRVQKRAALPSRKLLPLPGCCLLVSYNKENQISRLELSGTLAKTQQFHYSPSPKKAGVLGTHTLAVLQG